ncbi:acetoacetate decarboxylase family protein [Amycolatopsis deserti]|nr:acetoacetate decarboxylase family protein [Amycolatopsis deserti]
MSDYPPEPWHLRGDMHVSAWVVPVGELPELPPGVRPLTVAGRALVLAAWVDYQPPGVLSYRELMVTVVVRGGLTVTIPHIWVDSPASLAGGRALWHIPKDLAEFTLTEGRDSSAEDRAGGERVPGGAARAGGDSPAGLESSRQAGAGGDQLAGREPGEKARAGGDPVIGPGGGQETWPGFIAGAGAGWDYLAGREPGGKALSGGNPLDRPNLGAEAGAGVESVAGTEPGGEARAGVEPIAGAVFSAEARAGGELLARAEFRRRHVLPLRVPLAFSVLQRGPKRSPVRVAARLGVARSAWRVGAGGPLAFLAGRRPLLSLVARDFRMRFGGGPDSE